MIIPFAKPYIDDLEKQAVTDVISSGWLTSGPKVKELEEKFAKYVGANHAIAVDSCTSALFLAIKRWNLQEGSSVKVPSLTFSASASTIVHNNLKPLFVDVDRELKQEEDLIENQILVNLTGVNTLKHSGSNIIVDSAHLIEKHMCYAMLGSFCFSFYPTKNLASAEGGMICTNNDEDAKWFRLARAHGQTKDNYDRYAKGGSNHWEYSIEFPGYKMNMTDIQAAIALVQLDKFEEMEARRKVIVDRYNEAFGLDRTGLHLYYVLIENRKKFLAHMTKQGISCSVHFLPLHKMPAYEMYEHEDMTNTNWMGDRMVSLPLYPGMTDEEVDYIIKVVGDYGNGDIRDSWAR